MSLTIGHLERISTATTNLLRLTDRNSGKEAARKALSIIVADGVYLCDFLHEIDELQNTVNDIRNISLQLEG